VSTELQEFELAVAADSSTTEYSRERIPNDKEREPCTLTGLKRIVFLVLYALIVSSSIGGMIYTFYVSPWFALAILPVCYVFNNLLFVANHSRLHASFIELPEAKMNVICHHAFIHHYRNICVFHETWLETRMSYFIDARAMFDRVFRGFILVIPIISVIFYRINPVLGIGFFSSQYLAELLQSTIHEWYHNPARNRKTFYSFPVYWTFVMLEKIGLASTKRHLDHHRHQLPTLDKVEVWLDLYVPFGEIPVSRFWEKALSKYVPGQTRMTDYVNRVGSLYAYLVFFLINPAIYLLIYLMYFADSLDFG
jgi:hypothetical protein